MAKAAGKSKRTGKTDRAKRKPFRPLRLLRKWLIRAILAIVLLVLALILIYSLLNPPITLTMLGEKRRLGEIERQWVPLEEMAPAMARSAVAAEDANFCLHWGFDVEAIRTAMEGGGNRGASTISQQVVKNVFFWQGRNWLRKALEAATTPAVEALWSKRRILEVYLNVAETGNGIFGVEAAAQHYFGVSAAKLSDRQAALIAAALPNPKERNPAKPSNYLAKRARAITDGAATIRADGRAACFED